MRIKQSTLILVIGATAALLSLLLGSGVFMLNAAVQAQKAAVEEQIELKDLGVKLADSSDYLTDEARKFVVTTDVDHLNRYWQEVEVTKTRDQVVARLKEMGAPQAELDLIEKAKADSDGLVRTETRAMRLVLEATGGRVGVKAAIAAFPLSDQDRALSAQEKLATARRIMFDARYTGDKAVIEKSIEDFKTRLSERAARAVAQARAKTSGSVALLVAISLILPTAMGAVLWLLHTLVGVPVAGYIRALQHQDPEDSTFALELKGTVELQQMAETLNQQFRQNHAFQEQQKHDLVRLNELALQVTQNANQLNQASVQMTRASLESDVAVQQVAQAIQSVANGAGHTRTSVQKSSMAIAELTHAVEGIAQGAEEQSREVWSTTSTVEQMASNVAQVADTAQQVADTSHKAKQIAEQGFEAVQATRNGMTEIQTVVSEAASKVEELGQLGERIGAVVETIDDIAEQTNLLALNAAIEAARAGDHGRGFSVVADEVRKLAERSQSQTKSIADLIRQVQRGTQQAVAAMAEGRGKVDVGAHQADQAGRALTEILDAVASTVTQVEAIALAAKEMADGSKHVVSAMNRISAVAERNSASTNAMATQSTQVKEGMQAISAAAEDQSAAAEQMSSSADEMAAQMKHMAEQAKDLEATAFQLEELMAQFSRGKQLAASDARIPALAAART